MHECQVEAVFGAVRELVQRIAVARPARLPRGLAEAHVRGELGDGGDSEGGVGRDERVDAVVEIGKKEDFAGGEGVDERGLVDAVERAGLYFADTTSPLSVIYSRWTRDDTYASFAMTSSTIRCTLQSHRCLRPLS